MILLKSSLSRVFAQHEIADALFISIRTVDRHRANIASKLDLTGAHALLQFAVEHKAEL